MTYTVFLIVIMIIALLLILIIMVQNPKGGGLSSSFGGGGTQSLGGGVQNTTNFLDKSTWSLSLILLALILLSNFAAPRASASTKSEIENTIENRDIQDLPATTTTAKDSVQ